MQKQLETPVSFSLVLTKPLCPRICTLARNNNTHGVAVPAQSKAHLFLHSATVVVLYHTRLLFVRTRPENSFH